MSELARSILGALILRLSLRLDGLTAGPKKALRSSKTGDRRLAKARTWTKTRKEKGNDSIEGHPEKLCGVHGGQCL